MNYKGGVVLAALVLGLVALVHLFRVIHPFPVVIGTVEIPNWASGLIFLITGILCACVFRSLHKPA